MGGYRDPHLPASLRLLGGSWLLAGRRGQWFVALARPSLLQPKGWAGMSAAHLQLPQTLANTLISVEILQLS
jgi:hypothetical protein